MQTTRNPGSRRPAKLPLAVAICFAISSSAFAQDAPAPATDDAPAAAPKDVKAAPTLGAVTVTAQKREENLQEVPVSIQVLGSERLEQEHATDFDDYAKLLPSVSFDRGDAGGSVPYMRGVASGENSNHSGPQPSVGVYLDEEPVTTIGGVIDVNLYDIERVEALAGPQGTLYGASSQAGTLRLISKKPDPSGFSAGYTTEVNSISHGGNGFVAEGFVNIPFSDAAALRVVAWDKKDAGWIDNVPGTRTFPGWDELTGNGTIDNSAVAKKDYNDTETRGGRAALKIDLGENWTITPTVLTQTQNGHGSFSSDPVVGELETRRFYPERFRDAFTQAALTVTGKIGNFDLTYAYTHLNRHIDSDSDYSDYSFWYDAYYTNYYRVYYDTTCTACANYYDNDGNIINPSQRIHGDDRYMKTSHELRLSSPQENRFRFLVGLFWQQQQHKILQDYYITGLATARSVTGWPNTVWLTNQLRRDHDEAYFGEMSFDITDKLTATGGLRYYSYDNSLKGFFGFHASAKYGETRCFSDEQFQGAPCVNLDDSVQKKDHIAKVNLTYKINDTKMIYGTWSEGFRPGGVNRSNPSGQSPVYLPDTLTNYEFGWKTSWMDNRVVFNGAIFQENWDTIQFSFIPPGGAGLTIIRNAGGARIRGLEADLSWAATYNFQVTGGIALYDAKLTTDYCGINDIDGNPITVCPPGTIDIGDPTDPDDDAPIDVTPAPKGTQLPVTARVKGNLSGRYTWDIGEMEAYWQGSVSYEGKRRSYLTDEDAATYGDLGAYSLFDFSIGIKKNNWALDFYVKNLFDERDEQGKFASCVGPCATGLGPTGDILVPGYPNGQHYVTYGQPRTIGIRFSQSF